MRAIPGVQSAGLTSTLPFGGNYNDSVILAEGYQMAPGESLISPSRVRVTPGFFEVMRIPLKRGRLFDGRDTKDAQRVVIVDERLARKFWPGRDPIGRRLQWDIPDGPFLEVVGVAAETVTSSSTGTVSVWLPVPDGT